MTLANKFFFRIAGKSCKAMSIFSFKLLLFKLFAGVFFVDSVVLFDETDVKEETEPVDLIDGLHKGLFVGLTDIFGVSFAEPFFKLGPESEVFNFDDEDFSFDKNEVLFFVDFSAGIDCKDSVETCRKNKLPIMPQHLYNIKINYP